MFSTLLGALAVRGDARFDGTPLDAGAMRAPWPRPGPGAPSPWRRAVRAAEADVLARIGGKEAAR